MPKVLAWELTVGPDDIDELGHVSNLRYVAWMQEVAIRHSAARGWSLDRYVQAGAGWVVRAHHVRYKRPAFAGERITAWTWVHAFGRRGSTRRYLFRRSESVLVEAETEWAYVDLRTLRPAAIPADLAASFQVLTPEEEAAVMAGRAPEDG